MSLADSPIHDLYRPPPGVDLDHGPERGSSAGRRGARLHNTSAQSFS